MNINFKRFVVLIGCLQISCLGMAECNLRIAVPTILNKKSPVQAISWWDKRQVTIQFDTLVRFGNHGEILPWLAKKWTVSSDLKSVLFELREGVKFSNGVSLQAENVTKSLQQFFGSNSIDHDRLKDVESVSAKGPLQVEIKLTRPFTPLLFYLATPRSSIFLEKENILIGTGPWIPKEEVSAVRTKSNWTKNPNYFQGSPKCESISLITVASADTAKLFVEKELDLIEYYPTGDAEIRTLDRRFGSNAVIRNFPSYDRTVLFFTDKNSGSQSIAERRWVAKSVSSYFLKNKSRQDNCSILPFGFATSDVECSKLFTNGWRSPKNIEIYAQDDERSELMSSIGRQISNSRTKIKVKLCTIKQMYEDHSKGLVSAHVETLTMQIPDPYGVLSLFISGAKENFSKYSNKKFDVLIEKAVQESDITSRGLLYSKAEKLILQDAIIVPLVHQSRVAIISNELSGYEVSSVGPFYASYDKITKVEK